MYPIIRLIKELIVHGDAPDLPPTGTHVSQHICWPWDIDHFLELNNGRTLTLYDLGRYPLAKGAGLLRVLRKNRWGLTMAGASVRYRKRIALFDRFEMRSRALGYDDKFVYLEQSMWRGKTCCNQIVYRSAVTNSGKIVPPHKIWEELGADAKMPDLPDWVKAWIIADATRPWPPQDPTTPN
jgi:acyl-CoA thioesterase FadM